MIVFNDHTSFTPDLTPAAILYLGAFGGTYYRPIYSSINKKHYEKVYTEYSVIKNLPQSLLTLPFEHYDSQINLYKVKCGATLEYWESKKWIKPVHPYGWFQWYCEFYEGKRTADDARQIKRWILRKRLYKNTTKTPKIRQVLLHWAILN